MSLVGVTNAEWKTRKINLMEVFRSFISQLRPNQELTRVSLPSVLCHPFSMLEVVAHRKIVKFHELFGAIGEPDALERFMKMVRFYFTITRNETNSFEKKPYNPVIGESHFCWVKNDEDDYTEFISEQVSHHPPISAYFIQNKNRDVRMEGNLIFKVSFGSNYVSVTTSGFERIQFSNETYHISKCIPDMVIKNVVWGKKYLMWIGDIEINCPDTGYMAHFELSEKNKKNLFTGYVKNIETDEIIYDLEGVCGEELYYYPHDDEDEKQILIDMSTTEDRLVHYQKDDQLMELASLRVWQGVNESIVNNDMKRADQDKKSIEKEQRKRISERKDNGTDELAEYFEKNSDDHHWYFKDNITLAEFFGTDE